MTKSIQIAEINTAHCLRQDLGDLPGLAASIERHGLLHPIGVTADKILVFGLRRLKACELLGWVNIPATIVGGSTNG